MKLAPPSCSLWRSTYIILCCSVTLLVAIYWATAASTVALWFRGPFSHGFLVIPVAAYLAWDRRAHFETLNPTPSFWALPLLALLAFVWLLGHLTSTGVVQHFCLVAMFIALVWGALGTAVTRSLLFPLMFLLFAVPAGERLIPTLQDFTARFAVTMLHLSRVPVLLEGHVISIPGGSWRVAEACSGISYLFSSMAVGFLYAGLAYRSWTHRSGFFLASGVVPLLANGLRVYTVILIASLGGTGIAFGIEHYLYGWLFFAMIMGLLFAVGGRWSEEPQTGRATSVNPPSSTRNLVPRRSDHVRASSVWNTALLATLGILVVGAAPLAAELLWNQTDAPQSLLPKPPEVSLPWKAADRDAYAWTPRFATASAEFLQSYDSGNHAVKFYAAHFGASQPDVKLASVGNRLFDEIWLPTGEGHSTVTVEGQSFQVHETFLRSHESSLIVWNWYWVDGTFTSNDYMAKLLFAKARLLRSDQGYVAFAVATEDQPDQTGAAILRDFLSHASLAESMRTSN